MNSSENSTVRVAILDLYEGQENQGMRCLRDLVKYWGQTYGYKVELQEFDVRLKNQVPSTDFDIYISSGGPGSPLETINSEWEKHYFKWLNQVEEWNNNESKYPKKHVLFICHSFQLASRHYNIGNVCQRNRTSFGVYPIHVTEEGKQEIVFDGLPDPFYAVDSRGYQVIEPDLEKIEQMGGKVLALEKERPHVPFERAVMAVRFNEYFIGTQFHPEADAIGMSLYLQREDKKKTVIENYGEEKWQSMVDHLNDPDKILFTYLHLIPNFLNLAVASLVEA